MKKTKRNSVIRRAEKTKENAAGRYWSSMSSYLDDHEREDYGLYDRVTAAFSAGFEAGRRHAEAVARRRKAYEKGLGDLAKSTA